MTSIIDKITADEFKARFGRDFPFIPLWNNCKTYFTGDIVYFNGDFFKALSTNKCSCPSNLGTWELAQVDESNYINDLDIEKALSEARVNFNPDLFSDPEKAKLVFLYLAAHYLVIDLNNAANPLALGSMGFTQSKSVGSVSESYGIPQWIMNSKTLGLYAQTGYGRKYLSLISPYLIGNIILTRGKTTYG